MIGIVLVTVVDDGEISCNERRRDTARGGVVRGGASLVLVQSHHCNLPTKYLTPYFTIVFIKF